MVTLAAKRDCYDILGISKNADDAQIKRAYRKLAKKYHPDMNPGNSQAEQKFKEVTEAYEVLSDPKKKKLYDQYGYAAFDGTGEGENPFNGNQGNYREYHFESGDMDDIFGDIFGGMFGNKKKASQGYRGYGFHDGFGGQHFQQKGSDAEAEISISFDEAVSGCTKTIHLQSSNGGVQSLQVRIPAGIDTGKSIRLRGKGNSGLGGGEPGDLLLKVTVGTKPGYERKGMDVYTTVNIPFTTAVFGGEAVVETLYGNVVCKIREGTQSGTKIRLRGKGIVSMKNSSVRGDQYVTVQIQVPTNLSPEEKQKLIEYDHIVKRKNRKHAV